MTRRVVWSSLLLAAVLAVFGTWLMLNLERVPTQKREPPQSEARRNPWLALERFTARMGGQLTRASDARILDRLPAGSLLLDRQRAHLLTPERLHRLLAWVEAGGYLIAVAEHPGVADPLLDSLGVKRVASPRKPARQAPAVVDVLVPGAAQPLKLAAGGYLLAAGERQPAWSAGQRGRGEQVLHFHLGRGEVTVAAAFDGQLSNRHIGEEDHADLYWSLLRRYDPSPQPQVLLLSRLQMPTLFAWLWENAWAACTGAALLIVLWLWRIIPRFGSVRPEAPAGRRELREHLAAIGRYQWRSGGLAALLTAAREHFHARLLRRQPTIAALPATAQPAALAALSNRPAVRIAAALDGPVDSPHAFTDALRTLRNLERDL